MVRAERLMILLRVIVIIVLAVEWRVKADRLRRSELEQEPLSAITGQSAKMVYRPTNDLAVSALKFGKWTKNNLLIEDTDNLVTGSNINREKKRFWLRIKSAGIHDSGLYAFMINATVVKQWLLQVEDSPTESPKKPCGGPLSALATICVPFTKKTHPNCLSFPGPPLNMKVSSHLHEGMPIVQVTWKPPNTGYNSLWGYQLYIAGKDYHPGHYDCHQINRKEERLYWVFMNGIRYGAIYRIIVQSMPAHHKSDKNDMFMDVKVPEKCQFPEYTNSSECCSIINITAEYNETKIHLKWSMPLQDQCMEIKTFIIKWNNIQKPEECNGHKIIKGKYEYIIALEKEECTRFNYSIKLSGKINKTETKVFKETVLIPLELPPTPGFRPPATIVNPPDDDFKKILMAVVGAFLGLLICSLFVMYRIFFQQVQIELPGPLPRPHSNDPLLETHDKKRVFIMYTRCCEKCSYVVHCFGSVLNSTELIEASIDMWSTLDIAPNVPRWYEDQVKNSHCVVVLASHKMSLRCQNTAEEGDDPLNIRCQLNLMRGQIAQNPDVRRFIPAFFTCSGSKKNIPEFMCNRWSHKLPKEVDRVIFHLLNVEKIQPYRTQPIVVMGGNGHPFDVKKKELEIAVQDAEMYHKNNNIQNV